MLNLMGKCSIATAFHSIYVFTAEVFPTTVRSVGGGFCSCVCRISSILAPFSATLVPSSLFFSPSPLTSLHPRPSLQAAMDARYPAYVFGSMSLLAGLCAFSLPETAHRPLPEDVADAVAGPLLRWVGFKPRQNIKTTNNDGEASDETLLA